MLTAIDDIHHRHRQNARLSTADIAIKRLACGLGGGFGNGHRDAQNRVRTQTALILGAVHFDHNRINCGLFSGVKPNQRVGQFAIDARDRLLNTFAHIARFIAIAHLNRLIGACGCTRRHSRAAQGAIFEDYIHLNGGVATAVENFAGVNINDGGHGLACL